MSVKTVLFPTDFSTASDAALPHASILAQGSNARMVILHVEEPPVAYAAGQFYYGVSEPDKQVLEKMLQAVVPADSAIAHEHRLVVGDPSEEVIRVAKEEHADMIVMGTHGRSGVARLLMGSVAEYVLRHAPCPVMVIRQPEAAAV
ncbi:MAG: universal stress protein [Pirellulales bacterium]|nr:universal stress protein [Pirellulales bacterium]